MHNEVFHIPYVICGGGILGLLLAKELSHKFSPDDLALFEKNEFLGEGNTSRNSGVLHSGIYYPTDSLKHKHCLAGNKMWRNLASELDITVNPCGKFIVASTCDEVERTKELREQAKKNDVPFNELKEEQINKLKEVINYEDGFFIPSTGIVDISEAIKKIENHLFNKNVPIIKNDEIISVEFKENKFFINTKLSGAMTCDYFFNVAGTDAINIRKMLGHSELENYFVKGNYVKLNKKYYNESLIYPVPQKNLKGLGVHTSFATDGIIRFGPNTQDVDHVHFKVQDSIVDEMYPEVIKVFKGINKEDLSPDYSGVRPKIKLNGELHTDFWIKKHDNYIECCGIESPGLTAAPSIAKYLIELIK
ncbi:MAG: FAD-dependent oxidoreductase [Oligoflexia bacterium]|nr:FAD-dependent oxidoreductase [Oligoflexia bacterium]